MLPIYNDSSQGKAIGNYLQQLQNDADSFRKLLDSLHLQLDSLRAHGADRIQKVERLQKIDSEVNFLKNYSIYLSFGLLFFGLVLILVMLFFLYKLERGFGNYGFQLIGLIVVVIAALFLIVTGYDKDQITPIIGLLGTIVGFIFGSNISVKANDKPNTTSLAGKEKIE